MRMAHLLTFYDPLRYVLFLNRFMRIITHTRHYSREAGRAWQQGMGGRRQAVGSLAARAKWGKGQKQNKKN